MTSRNRQAVEAPELCISCSSLEAALCTFGFFVLEEQWKPRFVTDGVPVGENTDESEGVSTVLKVIKCCHRRYPFS